MLAVFEYILILEIIIRECKTWELLEGENLLIELIN